MRVLLDESVPKGLRELLAGHAVKTVQGAGWSGNENGKLLALASTGFDVLVTADRGFEHEQNPGAFDIAIVLLLAKKNRMVDYRPLQPLLQEAVDRAVPGTLYKVGP